MYRGVCTYLNCKTLLYSLNLVMTLTSMKGLGSKRKKENKKKAIKLYTRSKWCLLTFINMVYLNLFFVFLPESKAIDFGGATGWNTTGNIAPGNWLSTWKKQQTNNKERKQTQQNLKQFKLLVSETI